MIRNLLAVIAAMLVITSASAEETPLGFADHPVQVEEKTWENAQPRIKRNEFLWLYRTQIREAAAQPPDFASHFVVGSIGCGTECQTNFLVNTKSGEVISAPVSRWGTEYYRDSRLLIVNPIEEDYVGDVPAGMETEYWLFDGQKFELLYSERPFWLDEESTSTISDAPIPTTRPE